MTIRGWFALVVISGLCGCAGPAPDDPAPPFRGELALYAIDHGDGRPPTIEPRLRLPDGAVLILDGGIDLPAGTPLRVWGERTDDRLRVRRLERAGDTLETQALALIDAPKKPLRHWAFVLVDVDGGGNKVDKANAQDVLFNGNRPDSLRSYFREVSYGIQDLDGQVFGPFPYQMDGRCDTDRVAQTLAADVQKAAGGATFDQYLWFYGTFQKACDWAGIADLGSAARPTRHTWYNAVSACNVLVQEPGHNFGMVHSSSMHCTVAGQPVPIAWPGQEGANCEHDEYGNPFDPMGGGGCTHMNGIQKAYQDWLDGCNVVKATTSGTYTIYPLESTCDGPQLLQIPFPAERMLGMVKLTGYYLELRAPLGYRDRKLTPRVLVMVANDVRASKLTGNRNWLLDMTPETMSIGDAALPVGKPFADALPGGPKFTLLSVDETKAVIQVEIGGKPAPAGQVGAAVCSDGKPLDPMLSRCITPPTPLPPDGGTADAGTTGDGGGGVGVDDPSPYPGDAARPTYRTDAGDAAGDEPAPPVTKRDAAAAKADRPAPYEGEPMMTSASSSGGCRLGGGGSGRGWGVLLVLGLTWLRQRRRR